MRSSEFHIFSTISIWILELCTKSPNELHSFVDYQCKNIQVPNYKCNANAWAWRATPTEVMLKDGSSHSEACRREKHRSKRPKLVALKQGLKTAAQSNWGTQKEKYNGIVYAK